MNKRRAFSVATGLLILSILFALSAGQYEIKLRTLWNILIFNLHGTIPDGDLATAARVLWSVRLPRVLMAVFAGAGLSIGGVVFQGIMRNPLVSPSFLGVTHGAVFGASIAIIFFSKSAVTIEGFAFFWAVTAVGLACLIGNRGLNTMTTLVLGGVIVSAFFLAAGSFLQYIADPYDELPAIVFWHLGGLNNILWTNAIRALAIISTGVTALYLFRWRLNLLALGDEEALSLGINVKSARILYILSATLMVAAASSSCGIIMWVDLIAAHISRLIIGPDHNTLIPFAALVGAILLLLTDTVVRMLPGGEIPISIITSFIGAPLLGYLLIKQNSAWKE